MPPNSERRTNQPHGDHMGCKLSLPAPHARRYPRLYRHPIQ